MRFFTAFRGFRALLALAVLASAWCSQRLSAQAFGTAVVIQTTGTPIGVYVGDFDGDHHHQDILALVPDSTVPAGQPNIDVDIFYGDGKGNFTPAVMQGVIDSTHSLAVTIADMDEDGISDFAFVEGVVNISPAVRASLNVWFGTSQRTVRYAPPPHIDWLPFGSNPSSYSSVLAIADGFNGGGSLGLVVLDAANQNGTVYQDDMPGSGVGVGNFAPIYNFSLPSGAGPTILAQLGFGGPQGLVVVGQPSGTVDTFLGTGSNPVFHAPQQSSGLANIQSFLLADVNNDGNLDLIGEVPAGRIEVFAGNGYGTFSSSSIGGTTSVDSTTGDGGQLLAAADLNNDGRPDLITYNPATANDPLGVSVELATASGNFSLLGVYPVPTGSHSSFATADFNQDGFLDLAMDTPGGIAILYGKAAVGTIPATGAFSTGPATAFEAAIPMTVTLSGTSGNPVPTGTVTFTVTGTTTAVTPVAVTLQNGVASYTFPAVTPNTGGNPVLPGTPTFTAAYSGDSTYAAKTLTATHAVNLGITTVTLTPAPPTTAFSASYFYGQPVNGYVNISPQDSQFKATGTWTQLNNNAPVAGCIGLPNTVSSVCPYGYPTLLDTGSYSFVEQYNGGPANGDPVNGTRDSAPYNFTVQPSPTVPTVTSSNNPALVGSSITFTVSVASTVPGDVGVPTGTISLSANGQILASALPLNAAGQASLTTSSLATGSYAVTAVYTPSPVGGSSPAVYDFLPSSSAIYTQVVNPAGPTDFTLTVTPLPVSLTPGTAAVLLVTVKSTGGFNAPVALSCTGLKTTNQIGCAFAPATLPGGGGSATLALSTLAPYPCGQPANPYAGIQQAACGTSPPPAGQTRPLPRNLAFGGAIFAGVLLIGPLRRRRRPGLLVAVFSLSGLLALLGCGNCTNLGTEPGNYTINVVGTSSGATPITHSVVVNINVHL
jgi:hypothetical protein